MLSSSQSRRRLLQTAAGLVALGGVAPSVTAAANEPVFVHPTGGRTGRAIQAVTEAGGRAVLTYDNFAFVAARIPRANRGRLERDDRVAFVEADGLIRAIDPVEASPPDAAGNGNGNGNENGNGKGKGGGNGCASHPAQEPSWGYTEIGAHLADATGAGVAVAVLDTGIQSDHCDLRENVRGGYNATIYGTRNDWEDDNGHGTHCAGIVGALDNGIGVVGVAPNVDLYAVKVLNQNGSGWWSWFVGGVDWCLTNRIPIMTASLGASKANSTVGGVVQEAYDRGHVVVAAAGNAGSSPDDDIEYNVHYPGAYNGAIAVGAMEPVTFGSSPLASYSSTGAQVELMAPGSGIRSTYVGNGYRHMSGTSMATPHVAGVAALVAEVYGLTLESSTDGSPERNGSYDPAVGGGLRGILRDTADPTLVTSDTSADYPTPIDDSPQHDKSDGYGLVRADAAVAEARRVA